MTMTQALRPQRARSDYAALKSQIQDEGLLDRSIVGALPRIIALAAVSAVGVLALIWLKGTWWQLTLAAYFAIVFAQLGFLGHDAGHQQIFEDRRWNDRLGLLLSNACVGLSYGWWVDKHNRHHRHPNHVDRDPDVQRNILAWTPRQADQQRGVFRLIGRRQDLAFFPLILLEAFNLHVGSVLALRQRAERRRLETALLVLHVSVGIGVLLAVMQPLHALVFLAIQQALFGVYLGMSFAPNHKGMQLTGSDDEIGDYLRRQVLSSRNVAGGWLTTAVLGGLNLQIEHHLFPSMPSRYLRRARPLVRRFCDEHAIPYCETGPVTSYRMAMRYLRDVQPAHVLSASTVD